MAETFDAVLAEMLETADVRDLRDGAVHTELVREWRDRLAAAHAAEVAERDARIAELEKGAEFFAVVSDCEFVGIPDLRRTARGLESAQCTIATIGGKPTVRLRGLRIDGHGAAIATTEQAATGARDG